VNLELQFSHHSSSLLHQLLNSGNSALVKRLFPFSYVWGCIGLSSGQLSELGYCWCLGLFRESALVGDVRLLNEFCVLKGQALRVSRDRPYVPQGVALGYDGEPLWGSELTQCPVPNRGW